MGIFALIHHSARCIMQWSLTWKREIVCWEVRNINTGKNPKVRRVLRNFPFNYDGAVMLFLIFSFNEWGRCPTQMYTAGHVYVFASTKGSLWCCYTSGPWRAKHCWYASHGALFFPQFGSLFMVVLVYFAEKCQQPSPGSAIISSKGIINQADIPRMVWHKTNTLSPAACARLKSSFP